MADKSWMLNPKAIRHANECIHMIKKHEGLRLKLSQPDFLQQLHTYVEKLKLPELGEHYSQLLSMAGVGNVLRNLEKIPAKSVVAMPIAAGDYVRREQLDTPARNDDETVNVNGHAYDRYRDGLEFKGLYRGNPRYA